jgi:hypothetical protein
MRRAAAGGVVAVWGGCLPVRETLPLLPVADALGELSGVDRGELLDAALAVTPRYVRSEVERLLPQLGSGPVESTGPGDTGQRDRLFAAIAELLGGGGAAPPHRADRGGPALGGHGDSGLPDVRDPGAPGFGGAGGGDVPRR